MTSHWIALKTKRIIDVIGSLLGLLLLSPFFILAAIIIRLTSKGPAFYRQTRMGHLGKPFTFMKFRTMHASGGEGIHKDYTRRFILGKVGKAPVFKIVDDPRVTAVGRLLRRTSLDELPQLVNVLKGEMSLVGPRPPVPYEWEIYRPWHRQRLMEATPGMTGLWQVTGRNTTSFNRMVRLDLKYARSWSLWLDLKILMKTPLAVVLGKGAC